MGEDKAIIEIRSASKDVVRYLLNRQRHQGLVVYVVHDETDTIISTLTQAGVDALFIKGRMP